VKERKERNGRGMMIGQTKQGVLRIINSLLDFDKTLFWLSGVTGGHADSKVIS
jgi:hypothetical protein